MTAQSLIELVTEESKHIDPSIAELYLSQALVEFCQQTRILRKRTSWTLAAKSTRQSLSEFDDIINLRYIEKDGVGLVNTDAPSYLKTGNGFWYVETNTPDIGLYLAWWDGNSGQAFEVDETFELLYEAQATKFAHDSLGNVDYSQQPEIPERFHLALTYRANEKAHVSQPEIRTYYYALYKEALKEAKKYANTMNTQASWNVKVYEL